MLKATREPVKDLHTFRKTASSAFSRLDHGLDRQYACLIENVCAAHVDIKYRYEAV